MTEERHFFCEVFKRGNGHSSHREEICATSLKEATEKAIDFISQAEAEGTMDKVIIWFSYLWGGTMVWKKLRDNRIARLLIPYEARRIAVRHDWIQLKAEYVKVLNVYDGETEVDEGISITDPNLVFRKGEIVRPDSYSHEWRTEPSPGIYCCFTRQQAEKYQL